MDVGRLFQLVGTPMVEGIVVEGVYQKAWGVGLLLCQSPYQCVRLSKIEV